MPGSLPAITTNVFLPAFPTIPVSYPSNNTVTQKLKELLNNKSDCIQTFLQGLTPKESTEYSLWKASKKLLQHSEYHKELGQKQTSKNTRFR
jgi:hypothetical protein